MSRQFWLMKSEPSAFSIEDLKKAENQTTSWDGVRNYQARNFMRDKMRVGDRVLFYHSSANPSGIVGECSVVREAYPDHTAWDPENIHYDPKSLPEHPIWYMVDVKLIKTCREIITLEKLRKTHGLKNMMVLKKGSRLSVQPVTPDEWKIIMNLPEWE
ncbi:MAG: EVE domain-containing protein [Firmicutes bacterium]|nr:EVE domain-containing protein [Bacillota bacterium]